MWYHVSYIHKGKTIMKKNYLLNLLINFVPSKRKRIVLRNKYFGNEIHDRSFPEIYRNHENYKYIYDEQYGVDLIYKELVNEKPSLICRFGSLELDILDQFIRNNKVRKYSYSNKFAIANNAGFFPADDNNLSRFASEMLEIVPNIDILGIWFFESEFRIMRNFGANYKFATIDSLSIHNIQSEKPWSRALKGKKVLVVHPFAETIKSQYKKRKLLFKNKNMLPDFELITLKAVQSIADEKEDLPFKTWFEALDYMKDEISKIDFDIALIGCGAYGIFLADYCKQLGKKGVHLGGATQILFGITGKRWETEYKINTNEHWVRPSESERPRGLEKVENGCYW